MKTGLSFLGHLSDEDKLLAEKVSDMIRAAEEKYINKFTFFLDERQQALCEKVLRSHCCENYVFFGGYESAERRILGVSAPYCELKGEAFPLHPLTFAYRIVDRLTHRDFLGCLMAQGIRRDTVGDILVLEGKTVVFVYDTVKNIASQISKIGRVGVKVSSGFDSSMIPKQVFEPVEGTVASLRLDCVLALAVRLSREKASALIRSGLCEVNHFVCTAADTSLSEGDVFSARGFGKFRLEAVGSPTKKDRLHLIINKYA